MLTPAGSAQLTVHSASPEHQQHHNQQKSEHEQAQGQIPEPFWQSSRTRLFRLRALLPRRRIAKQRAGQFFVGLLGRGELASGGKSARSTARRAPFGLSTQLIQL